MATATRAATVNQSLTPNRRARSVESDEFGAFARRIVRAYSRRVAVGDIEALAGLVQLRDAIDAALLDAVTEVRSRHGYSWAEIAARLGISRQAAQQRWGSVREQAVSILR